MENPMHCYSNNLTSRLKQNSNKALGPEKLTRVKDQSHRGAGDA